MGYGDVITNTPEFLEGRKQLTSGPDFTDRKLSTAVKVPVREEKILLGTCSH